MTLEEGIIHAEEVAERCAVTDGDLNCELEHRQLAEWLKELKAYRENTCGDAISRQDAIDAFERFIHELGIEDEPYNYGEMALSAKNVPPVTTPQPCDDCISRQAVIEVIKSMTNDNPSYWNSCDVINRENTLDEIENLPSVQKHKIKKENETMENIKNEVLHGCYDCAYHGKGECIFRDTCTGWDTEKSKWKEKMNNKEAKEILKHIGNNVVTINTYDGKIWHKEDIAEAKAIATHAIDELPSVTSQQRTGHWEWVRYDGIMGNWHCSKCRTIIPHMPEKTDNTPIYKWCPMCGAKMEVEE